MIQRRSHDSERVADVGGAVDVGGVDAGGVAAQKT
jgi:hypothetical protein